MKAAAEGIGLQSIPRNLGFETSVEVYIDSSAAKSVASRFAVGKVRHIHTKLLWIQEAVRDGRIKLTKISRGHNPARDQQRKNVRRTRTKRSGPRRGAGVRYWTRPCVGVLEYCPELLML